MNKIKVVQLVDDLNRGGLEKVVSVITHGLDQKKYDIEIWCMARGGVIADELRADGYAVKIFGITSYINPFNIFRLVSQLKKSKVSIVHAHGFFCQVIGALASVFAGIPVRIVHLHTTLDHFTRMDVFRSRVVNRFVDKIIYISKAGYESSQQAGCAGKDKSIIVYNGIDADSQRNQQASSQKNIITITASLTEHKGHRYLLRAVRQLANSFPDINLWIIGDGPLKEALEQEVKDLGLVNNVTFLGEQKEVASLLGQSKVFVLSSLREGLSLAIIEAMAQGRPVVAHRIGGIPEVVEDGVTGYLVEPGDAGQFAEKVSLLLSDRNKLDQMGREGRLVFEKKFTGRIMIDQIERIYDDLVKSKLHAL